MMEKLQQLDQEEDIQLRRHASLTKEQEVDAAKKAKRIALQRKQTEKKLDQEWKNKLQQDRIEVEEREKAKRQKQHHKWLRRQKKLQHGIEPSRMYASTIIKEVDSRSTR